jgi:hypothetical protein
LPRKWESYDSHFFKGQGRYTLTYEDALKLTEGAADVHRVLAQHAPGRGRGGDRKSARAKRNQTVVRPFDRSNHLAKPVLSARLAQEHPKVYEAYLRGEYRSIRAAAEAAGLVKPGHQPLQQQLPPAAGPRHGIKRPGTAPQGPGGS